MAQPRQPAQQHMVDEDDEFDEFPQEQWTPKPADLRARTLWDHAWDDASLVDEIGKQLRAKLPSVLQQPPTNAGQ